MESNNLVIASDIHGDIELLEQLCSKLNGINPENVYILGDTINFGRSPEDNLVIDLIKNRGFRVVLGNHEQFAFMRLLTKSRETQDQRIIDIDSQLELQALDYLGSLPQQIRLGPYLFVHCLPVNEDNKVKTLEDAKKAFKLIPSGVQACFLGHHHKPCCFSYSHSDQYKEEIRREFRLEQKTCYLINPGSLNRDKSFITFDPKQKRIKMYRLN